jgi:hypothetical protein
LLAGYGLLVAAWLVANPPGAAPDERDHYMRALAVGLGEVVGQPLPHLERGAFRSGEEYWTALTARTVRIPPDLGPVGFGCNERKPEVAAACPDGPPGRSDQEVTTVGTYEPLPYAVPGILMRLAPNARAALALGRSGAAVMALAVLAVGVAVIWDGAAGPVSLCGVAIAVTPMVIFVMSTLSGSGLEVASSIGWTAGLLRLTRPNPAPSWVPAATTAAGVALALSRTLGPAWIVYALVLVAMLRGPARIKTAYHRVRSCGLLAGIVTAAILSTVVWEVLIQPRPPRPAGFTWVTLATEWIRLPALARQGIGKFGALDTPIPTIGCVVWLVLIASLVIVALHGGDDRERTAVLAGIATAPLLVLIVGALAEVDGPERSYLQARWILPGLIVTPLLAGEIVSGRRLLRTRAFYRLIAAAGVIHLLAFAASSRRQAVGTRGPILFFTRPLWSPPLGWVPWITIALLGAAAVAAAPSRLDRRSKPNPSSCPRPLRQLTSWTLVTPAQPQDNQQRRRNDPAERRDRRRQTTRSRRDG